MVARTSSSIERLGGETGRVAGVSKERVERLLTAGENQIGALQRSSSCQCVTVISAVRGLAASAASRSASFGPRSPRGRCSHNRLRASRVLRNE